MCLACGAVGRSSYQSGTDIWNRKIHTKTSVSVCVCVCLACGGVGRSSYPSGTNKWNRKIHTKTSVCVCVSSMWCRR